MLTGALYLGGAVLQWRACWLAGGISAALFLVLFWRSELPYQALLQVYYLLVAVHGWVHWGSNGASDDSSKNNGHSRLPVQRWPLAWHVAAISAVLAITAGSLALRTSPHTLLSTLDALTAWGSVLATWLVARKVLENWLYWIVIDAAAVYLYWQSGLAGTAALFVLYTLIAIAGWIRWRSSSAAASAA